MTIQSAIRATFGENWQRNLIILLIATAAPPTFFLLAGRIRFDAAKFSEEWLKVWLCGIILFIALEFTRHRQEHRLRELQLSSIAIAHLLPHLESLQSLLKQMIASLEAEEWADLPNQIRNLHREQRGIGRCLEAYKNHLTPNEVKLHALVAEVEFEYWENVETLAQKVRSTSSTQSLQIDILHSMLTDVEAIAIIIESADAEGAFA